MLKNLVLVFSCIFLFGCELPKEIKRVPKTYEVIEIKKPKRFKVSLKDTENGTIYKMVRVSKRCSNWQKLKIGSKWQFDEVTYQYGDETYVEVDNVNELCYRLSKL